MSSEKKVARKLRAILSADVKGYSTLMANDEALTIQTLKEFRKIMSEIIEDHSGRVVDMPGDNIMAEFSSVVNAVQSAVAIQKILKTKNAVLPYEKRLEFRIGINIGDVVQDGDQIYGDGVNIAARIEGLAEPGGVCISRGAYDHIRNKLELGYEYIGEHSVKNIKQPVRVYKVLMAPEDAGKRIGDKPKSMIKSWLLPAIVVTTFILSITTYQVYQKAIAPDFEPASVENMAFALPDEPSIAVLPFDNMSKDPDQEYFSDGITEQIITSLSNVPYLFVIARNSTFSYKNKPTKVQQIAEELGVQYILEGSVQRSKDKVRITAQLIDAISGHHVWAENYDRKMVDIFELQDEITMKIVAELQVELSFTELGKLSSIKTDSLRAYEKYLRGVKHIYNRSLKDTLKARKLAKEAIELDPNYGVAYQLLAFTLMDEIYMHRVDSRTELLDEAEKQIKKSIQLLGEGPVHRTLSNLYLLKRQPEKALSEAQKAIEFSPNSARAYYKCGHVLMMTGRFDEAIPILHKAIRLNPVSPIMYLNNLAFAYAFSKQYEKAIPLWKETLKSNSDYYYAHLGLTAVYQLIGEDKKAAEFAEELLRLKPELSVSTLEKRLVQNDKEVKERFMRALRKAGIPDYPRGKQTDKPSIAVLPFDNMNDDPTQEYFSDGITEDIITALSKTPKLFVIARNSTFSYKGKSVKVQEIGKELGALYILEGSVRKAGDKVRITAQLIDAKTGHHLWAEKYDQDLQNIFSLQDKIAKKVITELQVELTEGELIRLYDKGTDNLDAYLKLMAARNLIRHNNIEDNHKAQKILEKVIELDPNYAAAYRWLGAKYFTDVLLGATKSKQEYYSKTLELAEKAVSLDNSSGDLQSWLGFNYVLKRQFDKAVLILEKAFELDPNGADTLAYLALSLLYMDDLERALIIQKKAIRLNPMAPSLYWNDLAAIHRSMGNYEEALIWSKKAVDTNPKHIISRINRCSILALSGQIEEAKKEAEKVKELNPKFSVKKIESALPYKNLEVKRLYIEGMRKAGLPD